MYKVLVDGEHWDHQSSVVADLKGLLVHLTESISAKHRAIVRMAVDGLELEGLDDMRLEGLSLDSVQTIEVNTENPRTLSIQILYEVAKYLARIADEMPVVAEMIQSRDEKGAFERLQEVLGTWIEINRGLSNAAVALGINFDEMVIKGRSMSSVHKDVRTSLDAAAQSLEQASYLELSDNLEYELAPKLRHLQECVYQMITIAEKRLN
ncbi:MAG TPA: hypothetical protein PKH07_02355 [bacterium]|nr:hypothetical protein [bacterium]